MSPTPGRSTLMQSAPMYARSCVQVGPDCTWVKSRIFTPSSALPAWPNGLRDGGGRPFFAAGFFDFSFTTFFDAALDLAFAFLAFFSLPCVVPSLYFLRSALCGLRLPMRPLSLPAAGSSTALIKVGLPEFMASLTARFSSSGVVALTPTPPKASIILS